MAGSKPIVVHYPAPEKPLTQEQVARALAQLGKRDDLWVALMQMLQVRLASAISGAIGNDPQAAGRLAEITELQEQIKNYRDMGMDLKRKDGG
jgi:hypothetical protein